MAGSRAGHPAGRRPAAAAPARRKPPDRYHHGDLRRALVEQAVRIIHGHGVERLTLRGVGRDLGVSRTALYRHFADKGALLEAVAAQGFRMLRKRLAEAWTQGGPGRAGFAAMASAYVRFALDHPSHYRVMFGAALAAEPRDADLAGQGAAAFQTLVDALTWQQQEGLVREDDPLLLANYVWAIVHGISMLALDRRLRGGRDEIGALVSFAVERIRGGIERPPR